MVVGEGVQEVGDIYMCVGKNTGVDCTALLQVHVYMCIHIYIHIHTHTHIYITKCKTIYILVYFILMQT